MQFNSITFLVFLPIVFAVYHWIPSSKIRSQNILLLIASYMFYGWWDWHFLGLIFISSITDYLVGLEMGKAIQIHKRKFLLLVSIVTNLGILGFFKYFNFFIDSFVDLLSLFHMNTNYSTLQIILPVGISFYTFQTLSYTIDIYKNKIKPTKDIIAFFAFVAFFPQLVAGPIERAASLLPQFLNSRKFQYGQVVDGLRLMMWGFFKKMVIADRLAAYVDLIYSNPDQYKGIGIVIGTVFFAFQIYCDFSGYSDIAIGTAKLFGFNLMTNFQTPYFSASFREFWRRWHISLSTWFRDYLYIPLGGNRVSQNRWFFNIIFTFTISGLWHGANLTFIFWGLIHGFLLGLEIILGKYSSYYSNMFRPVKVIFVFALVCLTWIFFRAESIEKAFNMINYSFEFPNQVLHLDSLASVFTDIFINKVDSIAILISGMVFFIVEWRLGKSSFEKVIVKVPGYLRWPAYYLLIGWILIFGIYKVAPSFIYFQF
ncbi:MAG: MBOAT family protein [Bacteroidales bacterium]|nr:MBOAT family protein [Bacteroidales bacterium]